MLIDGAINNSACMLNVVIGGHSLVNDNIVSVSSKSVIGASIFNMKLDGPVIVSNNFASEIITCQFCSLMFAKDITIISYECNYLIVLDSEMHHIK